MPPPRDPRHFCARLLTSRRGGNRAVTTLLVTDDLFLEHVVPTGHPERPDRLAGDLAGAVRSALRRP